MIHTTHADRGWQVIEQTPRARYCHTFEDEWLAMQFAVSIGSQAELFFLPY